MERLALFTTVHPGVVDYLPAFAESVRAQRDSGFELWVALDGIEPERAATAMRTRLHWQWLAAVPGDGPARVRQRALERLAADYAAIVFVDADDVLLPERVDAARHGLERSDVSVCAMRMIGEDGRALGQCFTPVAAVVQEEQLAWRNVVGLSNSAYRSALLRRCLPIPDECRLVDWLLASRARAAGASFELDPEPRMLYRQHRANLARVLPPIDGATLQRGVELVMTHHRLLLSSKPPLAEPTRTAVAAARDRVLAFRDALETDPTLSAEYLAAVNARTQPFLWWEWVAHPALEPLWNRN